MIAKQMRDGLNEIWQKAAEFEPMYTHFEKKNVKVGIAAQLGLKSEELAALIQNGGGSRKGVTIEMAKAKAVHTAHGNPWAEY